MINKCLVLLVCLVLTTGCASELSQKYSKIYDDALNTDSVTIVAKNENFQVLKKRLSKYIHAHGYTKVIFIDPKQGFIVLAKQGSPRPTRLILKYTAITGEYTTRIDLANGSADLSNNIEVLKDIQEIADLIRNE